MSLHFTQVALSLLLQVPEASLQRHLAASPVVVGGELAEQVLDFERQHHLGYFPAIDYFIQHGGIDTELLDALQSITWVVTNMVRNELRTRLRPVFSQVKFESIQTMAYTMPSVRPQDVNALEKLVSHFSAMNVKVNITATLIQKIDDKDAAAKMASSMCYRWLKTQFTTIEVTSSKVLA